MVNEGLTVKMQRDDHDTLIRVEAKMDGLVTDVKELKDGLTMRVIGLETRMGELERLRDKVQPEILVSKLEEVYQWKHDFRLTWRVILTIVSISSSIAGTVVGLALKAFGW